MLALKDILPTIIKERAQTRLPGKRWEAETLNTDPCSTWELPGELSRFQTGTSSSALALQDCRRGCGSHTRMPCGWVTENAVTVFLLSPARLPAYLPASRAAVTPFLNQLPERVRSGFPWLLTTSTEPQRKSGFLRKKQKPLVHMCPSFYDKTKPVYSRCQLRATYHHF